MPYESWEDVNPALQGIEPKLTLGQANIIAEWADKIEDVESPFAVAIANFKKAYEVKADKWVKKEVAEADDVNKTTEAVTKQKVIQPSDNVETTVTEGDATPPDTLARAEVVLAELEKIMDKKQETKEAAVPEAEVPQEVTMEKLAETATGVSVLSGGEANNDQGPLTLKVKLGEPGFGNKRDNHYYPKEMWARDVRMFIGAKMHESEHGNDKNSGNSVSIITDVLGFTDTGGPLVEVVAYDPYFAQRVRNLNEKGLLETLECSILADAKVKRGQKIDGREANVVEAITKVDNVDWVLKAGAGGHAVALMEKAAVAETLKASILPEDSQNELAKRSYENVEKLQEAVVEHIEYLKRVTGSGKPFGQDGGHANERMSEEDYEAQYEKIMERHGVQRYGGK